MTAAGEGQEDRSRGSRAGQVRASRQAVRGTSFFDGLSDADRAELFDQLQRRRFPAGAVVLAEGDSPGAIFVLIGGSADVFVSDRDGVEHHVATITPESTVGEMSMLTGETAYGTVRAATELELLIVPEDDFDRLISRFPRLYRNVVRIVTERLGRTTRRALRTSPAPVTVLVNHEAPPLLGYALACSVAWHSRASTVLIVAADHHPVDLESLATTTLGDLLATTRARPPSASARAELVLVTRDELFGFDGFTSSLERLREQFHHVLLEVRAESPPHVESARVLQLRPRRPSSPDTSPGSRLHTIVAWDQRLSRDEDAGVVAIPPLGEDDRLALASGLLPVGTPASTALGLAARDVAALKVGIALGGGSWKGYAHIGVLGALNEVGLVPDYIAGCSAGAMIAALYAAGYSTDQMAPILDSAGSRLFRPVLPTRALLSSKAMAAMLRAYARDRRIEDLTPPLAIVAADLTTRREVVLRSGVLWLAVLASISIPGVYPPQRVGDYTLVDGGVVNPVPGDVAADMGADVVIAVRLVDAVVAPPERSARSRYVPGGRVPTLLDTVIRANDMMQSRIAREPATSKTIQITAVCEKMPGIGLRRFALGRTYVSTGHEAARAALPRIVGALPWLR
jgi:NTE family protein